MKKLFVAKSFCLQKAAWVESNWGKDSIKQNLMKI